MKISETPAVPKEDLLDVERVNLARTALAGGRCRECGAVVYPMPIVCYQCQSDLLESHDLPRRGVLASFTTIRVSTSRPVPYSVGYVDLPGDVRLLAPLIVGGQEFSCDAEVVLEIVDGGWGFRLATEEEAK
jgi:uncharacterized protein